MNSSKNYIQVKGDILFWKVSESKITVEQANQVAGQLLQQIRSSSVSKLLVDNLDLDGVFMADVNAIWENLMKDIMATGKITKLAVLSPSVISKMQIDRLSRQAGTYHFNRAFTDKQEALSFLGASQLAL